MNILLRKCRNRRKKKRRPLSKVAFFKIPQQWPNNSRDLLPGAKALGEWDERKMLLQKGHQSKSLIRNGTKVYVTGDTSATKQMEKMSEMEIDYAFYCCDGVYNMGMEESAKCAELVGARHNIPYHNSTSNSGEMFDRKSAERWNAPNRLIVYPGEEIEIK